MKNKIFLMGMVLSIVTLPLYGLFSCAVKSKTLTSNPLNSAAFNGNIKLLNEWFKDGSTTEDEDAAGMTPLMAAAFGGQLATTQELLDKNANFNAIDMYGRTPLMFASQSNTVAVVEELLKIKGIDVNAKDGAGWSAVMYAAHEGDVDIIQLLANSDTNINQRNNEGTTPLTVAKLAGRLKAIKALRELGATV